MNATRLAAIRGHDALTIPPAGRRGQEPADRFGWTLWWTAISIDAFVERLALLIELELPCVIGLGGSGPEQCCHGPLRDCRRQTGLLSLAGDDFCLYLNEQHIALVRLVDRRRKAERDTGIEIWGSDGSMIARVYAAPDRIGAAVWGDIMDTLALSWGCCD